MKTVKRTLSIIVVAVFTLSMAACGGNFGNEATSTFATDNSPGGPRLSDTLAGGPYDDAVANGALEPQYTDDAVASGATDDAVAGLPYRWMAMEDFLRGIYSLGDASPISHYGIEVDNNDYVFSHAMVMTHQITWDADTYPMEPLRILSLVVDDAPNATAIFIKHDIIIEDDGSIPVFYLNSDGTHGESTARFVRRIMLKKYNTMQHCYHNT